MPNAEESNTPDLILYVVITGRENEPSKWVRFGAAWKARKGYSVKLEPSFSLFSPFNNQHIGMAIMPFEPSRSRK